MLRLSLLLALSALVGCAGLRPSPVDETLTAMSFNVRYDNPGDGENAWPYRIDAVEQIIESADVVGLQEALPGMLADLDSRLDGWARIGRGRAADGGGEFCAIYYRTDRLDLVADGTFWLSETPEVPGSVGWDAALERIATWGRFRDRHTGRTFVILNAHFDHMGEQARESSARLIAERYRALALRDAAIVMGDFNMEPYSPGYLVLADEPGLRDARVSSLAPPEGAAATLNLFGQGELDRRIDYVWVRGFVVERFVTRDETISGTLGTPTARYPSDHFPVQATLRFEEPRSGRR